MKKREEIEKKFESMRINRSRYISGGGDFMDFTDHVGLVLEVLLDIRDDTNTLKDLLLLGENEELKKLKPGDLTGIINIINRMVRQRGLRNE